MPADKFDDKMFDWEKAVDSSTPNRMYIFTPEAYNSLMDEVDAIVAQSKESKELVKKATAAVTESSRQRDLAQKESVIYRVQRDVARRWNKRIIVGSIVQTVIGLVLAYLLSGCSYMKGRLNSWDMSDTVMEAGYMAVTTADIYQTSRIDFDSGFTESNPLMGRHPSMALIGTALAVDLVVHAAISLVLPDKLRTWWITLTTGARVLIVGRNCQTDPRLCVINKDFF